MRSLGLGRLGLGTQCLGLGAKRLGLGHLALFNNSGNVSHSHHLSIKSQRERGSMVPFHVAVFPLRRIPSSPFPTSVLFSVRHFPLGRFPRRIFPVYVFYI